ncbi:YdbH domain-containing protein [Sphingomonas bacterium]|uniref:YdbH domain-containing protein n=1 Tax=Sphingomonas bacterium TaxID=1895847 RepID=UPI0026134A35|nr:YdbH domain-containing protein [Sphingomonas bacterium]
MALLVLAVALAGLWLARKPITRGFVDRKFAEAHVPARYTIQELALGHQRLTGIVIGDPDNPDLVADWVELETSVGLGGARVVGISAGKVRVKGRIVDGTLSLGSLDRLIPKGEGGAFRLPAIALDLEDGRMRLETPQGVVGIKATGRGRLDGGFRGSIAAVSDRIAGGDCAAAHAAGVFKVDIRQDAIRLNGPLRAASAACGGNGAAGVRSDLAGSLAPDFARWHGSARLSVDTGRVQALTMAGLSGDIRFAGSAGAIQGKAALTADRLAGSGVGGQAGAIDGAFRYAAGTGAFTGQARLGRAAVAAGTRASFASLGSIGAGTPVAPLTAQLARALDAGARDFAVTADLSAATNGARGSVKLTRLIAVAESGASITLTSRDGTQFVWPDGGATVRGDLVMGGGGLPDLNATLAQAAIGAPVTGMVTIAPYEAGGARLALTPVKFSAGLDGRTRIDSVATLSGPLGGGSVEGLRLPVAARWDGRGGLAINPACAPVSIARLRVAGIDARGTATQLCPVDGAMLRIASGRVGGGAMARDLRVAGAIGRSPLALRAGSATVRLGERRFDLGAVAVRIGTPDRLTRFDIARLDGGFGATIGGTFGGTAGQIGAIPLLLSQAAGTWRMDRGKLIVAGTSTVSDAAGDPRFNPLKADQVALTLIDNRIAATGLLTTPGGIKVADVMIRHDLSNGTGAANLVVPGLHFGPAFKTEALTPLTKGVVENVVGTVSGEGHIRWSRDAVTSDGVFRTRDTDLAAAFGPVTGVSGEIHFTDLLGMVSAPNQVATVKTIDTGIAVQDGVIRYRLLGPSRIQVTDAIWPFAGGKLSLDPTTLDFLDPGGRHLTFQLTGVDAAQFLQQFDFQNLNATGIFDGTLPMIFDASGGRIENGRLKVRPGGGTIAYVGEVSKADLGTWGNIAFQALKSLRYRSLDLTMNGSLGGEVITEAKFAGVAQGEGAKSNFLIRRLARLPFVFNVRIRAPFRGLLETATDFYAPENLVRRALRQNAPTPPVQPSESEKVR